jgi:hypothetical protein
MDIDALGYQGDQTPWPLKKRPALKVRAFLIMEYKLA